MKLINSTAQGSLMQTLLICPQKTHIETAIETAAILEPQGSLSDDTIIWFIHQASIAVMSENHSSVVIDMKQVDSIDSAGLMAIVNVVKSAQKVNKRFCLCSVPRSVFIILELTQLDSILEIFENLSAFNLAVQTAT